VLQHGSRQLHAEFATLLSLLARDAVPDFVARERQRMLLRGENGVPAHRLPPGSWDAPLVIVSGARSKQRLTVEELSQLDQRRHGQTRLGFVPKSPTEDGVQHPDGDGEMHSVLAHAHDQAVPAVAPEPPYDLYFFAVEWVVPVVDRRKERFMGTMTMPCAIASRHISWKPVTTSVQSRSYWATAT
jgi:hypothetical protein